MRASWVDDRQRLARPRMDPCLPSWFGSQHGRQVGASPLGRGEAAKAGCAPSECLSPSPAHKHDPGTEVAGVAGRAPRTRFTAAMDQVIQSHLAKASGRSRRGEVRQAVASAAAQLGVPASAVLKRWYRMREQQVPAPPPPAPRRGRRASAAQNGTDHAGGQAGAEAAAPRLHDAPQPSRSGLTPLIAAFHRALASTAARRAELAQAEAELAEVAGQLAMHLLTDARDT